MREDMFKVIVERPRCGSARRTRRHRIEPEHPDDTHVFDVVKRQHLSAGERYAVAKRQLSGRELKENGLSNVTGDGRQGPRRRRKRMRQ